MMMRFATWNINRPGIERTHRLLRFLTDAHWDVVALQEVTPRAWEVISESGVADTSLYTLDGFDIEPLGKYPHGVALLARNGFGLSEPKLIPRLPKAERALVATTLLDDTPVTVAGWHAPNAAGEGRMTKRQGYLSILEWLDKVGGPVILGFDGNHWNLSIDPKPSYVPESRSSFFLENQFFGSNKTHRLRDALLDHLRQHPAEYEKIRELRPRGPLAVSYVRGSTKRPVEDRMDYVFISDEIGVISCSYDYEGARAAGSDHAILTADLVVRAGSSDG